MSLRVSPCRSCGEPIAFGRGRQGGWVPSDPESVAERVEAESGGFHFEPKLGHRRHECNPAAAAKPLRAPSMGGEPGQTGGAPLDAANWLDALPGGARHEDLRRALEHARNAIDLALGALNGVQHGAH